MKNSPAKIIMEKAIEGCLANVFDDASDSIHTEFYNNFTRELDRHDIEIILKCIKRRLDEREEEGW